MIYFHMLLPIIFWLVYIITRLRGRLKVWSALKRKNYLRTHLRIHFPGLLTLTRTIFQVLSYKGQKLLGWKSNIFDSMCLDCLLEIVLSQLMVKVKSSWTMFGWFGMEMFATSIFVSLTSIYQVSNGTGHCHYSFDQFECNPWGTKAQMHATTNNKQQHTCKQQQQQH